MLRDRAVTMYLQFLSLKSHKTMRMYHKNQSRQVSSLPIRIYNPIFLPSHVTCVAPVTLHLTTVSTTVIYRITITISQSISHHAGRHQAIIMSNREMDLLCINLHISPRLNGTKPSAQRLLFSYGK